METQRKSFVEITKYTNGQRIEGIWSIIRIGENVKEYT